MQSAFESIQSAAVRREYQEAVADGNEALAKRIRLANPDLFPPVRGSHPYHEANDMTPDD